MKSVAIFLTLLLSSVLQAQQTFDTRIATLPASLVAKTRSFNPNYLVHSPQDIKKPVKLPLVIYLHGGGSVGSDVNRIKGMTAQIVEYIQTKGKEAMIVVAPQCMKKTEGVKAIWLADDLNIWLKHMKATLPIDENRIYLTGTSMGGYGTWMWASSNPQHFAAVAPLCGGLGQGGPKDITPNLDRWAKNLATLPLWAFHGGKDTVVPPDRSERMVRAIKDNGSRDVKLTVYPELGHGIAKATYTDASFYEWLFKWRNDARPIDDSAGVECPTPGTILTFDHNKVERKYLLHLPKGLPNNAPLVFLLHGYRGDARDYMGELGMNRVADAHGFAVCYPQGGNDFEGKPHWNARLEISQTDDIGFLSELAAHLQARHKLNPNKTFVSGISNGGFMSYTLVAEKPEVFKAAASVIGTMSGHTWKHREKIRPVPILQISGLDDEVIPYDGSMSPAGGWGGAPNQDVIIDFWTKLNRTKTEEVVKISSRTMAYHYKDGVNHNEVWHYKIKGFGHKVPGKREMGINAVEIIWEFFSKF